MNPPRSTIEILLLIPLGVPGLAVPGQTGFVEFLDIEYRKHSDFEGSLCALREIDREELSRDDQLSYDLFEGYLQDQIFFKPIALGNLLATAVSYDRLLRHYTTTDVPARELFALPSDDVASPLAQVHEILTRLGISEGSMASKRAEAEAMSDTRATTTGQAVSAEMQGYVNEAQLTLAQHFSAYPEVRTVVTQVPGILSFASFRWGSENQGRPNQAQIAPGRDGVPFHLRRTVSYHEAFPGHYVQEFGQRRLVNLPEFRRK